MKLKKILENKKNEEFRINENEISFLPTGFDIKTVTITKKADGFYITFSLEDIATAKAVRT